MLKIIAPLIFLCGYSIMNIICIYKIRKDIEDLLSVNKINSLYYNILHHLFDTAKLLYTNIWATTAFSLIIIIVLLTN